ncbi:MAG: DinB family protein [Caldilineales bacterium]
MNIAINQPGEKDKQALNAFLISARDALLLLVRDLPPEQREQPNVVGHWSIRDVVGHLASWEHRLLNWVQMVRNHELEKIEWPACDADDDQWNHQQYLRKRAWTWIETVRELALLREEVLWNLAWAAPEQLFAAATLPGDEVVSMATFFNDMAEHDLEHVAQIRAWLAEQNA